MIKSSLYFRHHPDATDEQQAGGSTSGELRLGGLELGGTTIRVVVATTSTNGSSSTSSVSPYNIIFTKVLDTESPDKTLPVALDLLKQHNIDVLGIGSFGPLELDRNSKTYGYITSTPKQLWQNTNVVGLFRSLNVPIGFETDVNAAALSEVIHGQHGQINSSAYITVGTGIGAGVIVGGNPIEGLIHPEAGHILVRRHKDDNYAGKCPFHGDCCEGLAAGNAIAERLGIHFSDLKGLPDDHAVWPIVAYYLAQLCVSLALISSPQVIVIGGGVLKRKVLYPLIRQHTQQMLNGYLAHSKTNKDIDQYIVASRFDEDDSGTSAGINGVLTLAEETWKKAKAQ